MANKHNELIAKEGWIFMFPPLIASIVFLVLGYMWTGILLMVVALYVAWFFRNPYRQIPEDPRAIVSPGDGKVVRIQDLEDGRKVMSIFLNVFNVHVNRVPVGGKIEQVVYTKGQFVNAAREDASSINERNKLVIRDGDFELEVIQIAGLIARRIVCWVNGGEELATGERFGLIRFGSRMDIVMPGDCEVVVKIGDKVAGGSDIIARRPGTDS